MNILGFDCAGPVLSAGLLAGGAFYAAEAGGGQKHSELVMDMAEFLLEISGVKKKELDAAACMKGPGSFTGIRIGFAAAKGIALALELPVIAVPTLDCAAFSCSACPGIVLPVIDAKKNAFFAALYRNGALLTDYLDAEAEKIISLLSENLVDDEGIFLTGPGAEKLYPLIQNAFPRAFIDPAGYRGRARELVSLAEKTIKDGAVPLPVPMYLRKSDAEMNLPAAERVQNAAGSSHTGITKRF